MGIDTAFNIPTYLLALKEHTFSNSLFYYPLMPSAMLVLDA